MTERILFTPCRLPQKTDMRSNLLQNYDKTPPRRLRGQKGDTMLYVLETYMKRIDGTLFPEELMNIQHKAIEDFMSYSITPKDLLIILKYIRNRLDLLNY